MEHEKILDQIQTFVEGNLSKNHLYYFAHEHPMVLCDEKETDIGEIFCSGCPSPIKGEMYGCTQCQCFFHKSCAELPREIRHPSHKSHPLTLLQNLSQNPPLTFSDYEIINSQRCLGCNLPLWGTIYGCNKCFVFLHRFCLELPPHLNNRLHSSHRLFLNLESVTNDSSKFSCRACSKDHAGFNYQCRKCDFCLGIPCIFPNTSGFDHPMGHILRLHAKQMLDEPEASNFDCLACGEELGWHAFFYCCQCEFYLHFDCVLPPTLVAREHRHPLKLSDAYTEEGNSDEFYCDRCERERHPGLPVYHCAEKGCGGFVAHCYCKFLEGDLSIAHKLHNTELDTSTVMIENPDVTVDEIIRTCATELSELRHRVEIDSYREAWARKELFNDEEDNSIFVLSREVFTTKLKDLTKLPYGCTMNWPGFCSMQKEDNSISSTKSPFVYSGETFVEFLKIYESEHVNLGAFDPWERSSQNIVVKVHEQHLISKHLAPILEALFAKYGDFSAESTLSTRARTFIFDTLCTIVHSMCTIADEDITGSLLFAWLDCLKIIWFARFKIQFALDRFKKAFYIYFGLVYTDLAMDELGTDIAKLSQEVKAYDFRCTSEDRISPVVANLRGERSGGTIELQKVYMTHNSWNHYLVEIGDHEVIGGYERDEKFHKGEVSHSQVMDRSETKYMSLWDYEFLIKNIRTFFEKQPTTTYNEMKNDKVCCYRCELSISDSPFYKCTNCQFILQSSMELPQLIPCMRGDHNLIPLQEPPSALDVIDQKMTFWYVPHRGCFVCDLPIWGPKLHCEKHNTSFHQSCAQFPLEIQHNLHPSHPLLFTKNRGYLTCSACGEKFCGSSFSCQRCEFYLEVDCIFRKPVKSISHEHLLTIIERYSKSRERRCSHCNIMTIGTSFLYCGLCDLSFHLRCMLSPRITCSCHRHPLTFAECLQEDDSDEFYCDSCEDLRIPNEPVYHCRECNNYDAHIGCAIAKEIELQRKNEMISQNHIH
ncbi:Histone acetyltransferase, partial [Actinidia chinensis var. chinensis]